MKNTYVETIFRRETLLIFLKEVEIENIRINNKAIVGN